MIRHSIRQPALPVFSLMVMLLLNGEGAFGQTEPGTPVIVEAESGEPGDNVAVRTAGGVTYVTVKTNLAGSGPGDASRTVTYEVTFQDSGTYDFYVHLRVGAGGFDDDSFFYGRGFGDKDAGSGSDWVLVNGLGSSGFSDPASLIEGPGPLGSNAWKWVNLTKNGYQSAAGDPFRVEPDGLVQTFQIGGREDGLDIDKFAFGKSHLWFTVGMLENGLPGSPTRPAEDTTGTVWEGPAFSSDPDKFLGSGWDRVDTNFMDYWNQLTPGNAGKFGSVAVTANPAQWNWGSLDAAYQYAKTNGLIFKDHCLIWGQQQPGWITGSGLDSAQQADAIEDWIRLTGERYPEMDMIDVVNEPLPGHNPAAYRDALGGAGSTGWDWVIWAFQKARDYMPGTKLLLNEYGIINSNSATTSYLQIINLLKDRGLIDGIGVQGHRFEFESADTSVMRKNLDRLAATGLPVYISEFDLGNLGNAGTPDDDQQLRLYQKIFPVLWKHPGVKGITFWGYREGEVWQSSTYLVRYNGTARPALLWLAEYIRNNPPVAVDGATGIRPSGCGLSPNFPNPFNPVTQIRYRISRPSRVTIRILDMRGREVRVLVDTEKAAGQYTVPFDGRDMPSGNYFCRMTAGAITAVQKLVLIK
jgi:endo-1,4-beta-xylanase